MKLGRCVVGTSAGRVRRWCTAIRTRSWCDPIDPGALDSIYAVLLCLNVIELDWQGVSVIDFSPANNLLVTGSRDCTIRGWNPYISEHPVMVLRGHEAPVIFLRVNEIKVCSCHLAAFIHCSHLLRKSLALKKNCNQLIEFFIRC